MRKSRWLLFFNKENLLYKYLVKLRDYHNLSLFRYYLTRFICENLKIIFKDYISFSIVMHYHYLLL
jgi:hypothetical protein